MAYRSVTKKYNTADEAIHHVYDAMDSMGWELWDDDLSSVNKTGRIYRSNGEVGNRIHGYIHLFVKNNKILKQGWRYWDNINHTGHTTGDWHCHYESSFATVIEPGENLYVYGDKDLVYIATSFHRLSHRGNIYFGHYTPNESYYGTLSGDVAAGEDVEISVTEDVLDRFSIGHMIIVSASAAGGYQPARVTGLDREHNTITVDSLSMDFVTGDRIGWQFHTFFEGRVYNNSGFRINILGDMIFLGSSSLDYNYWFLRDYQFEMCNSDYAANPLYSGKLQGGGLVVQRRFTTSGSNTNYLNAGVVSSPHYGTCYHGAPKDFLKIPRMDEQPNDRRSASSATNYSLADDAQVVNWEADKWAGKVVLIVEGKGVYQSRKIISNTIDTLQIETPWEIVPDSTSLYLIVDAGYRMVSIGMTDYSTHYGKLLFEESF